MKAGTLKTTALCLVLALVSVPLSVASPADSYEVSFGSWLSAAFHRLAEIVDEWTPDTLLVVFEGEAAGSDQGKKEGTDQGDATFMDPPVQNMGGVHIPNG